MSVPFGHLRPPLNVPSVAATTGRRSADHGLLRGLGHFRIQALSRISIRPNLELLPPVFTHGDRVDKHALLFHLHGLRLPIREGTRDVEAFPWRSHGVELAATAGPEDQSIALGARFGRWLPLLGVHAAEDDDRAICAAEAPGHRLGVGASHAELHCLAYEVHGLVECVDVRVDLAQVDIRGHATPMVPQHDPRDGGGAGGPMAIAQRRLQ
mmetsp:Transcript_97444/g.280430  ORF Transcript_97444/g.280430 Transcript_97444/m.280430 type:complete len:211 (+) Transcript_97444:772-1404(+)